MVRRRVVLGALSVSLAGCSLSTTGEFSPGDHLPDEWHDTPERGSAEQVERAASAERNHDRACERTAIETVRGLVHDRLDDTTNVDPVTCCQEIDGEASLVVHRRIDRDRDGNVVSSPNVTFEEVRAATPESVTITVESDSQEAFVCSYPVYVHDTVVDID